VASAQSISAHNFRVLLQFLFFVAAASAAEPAADED